MTLSETSTTEKRFTHPVLSLLLAIITSYSLFIYNNPNLTNMDTVNQTQLTAMGSVPSNLMFPLLVAALGFFYSFFLAHFKRLVSSAVLSVFFAVFTVLGESLQRFNDARLLIRFLLPSFSKYYGYCGLLALLGYFFLYYALTTLLFSYLDRLSTRNSEEATVKKTWKITQTKFFKYLKRTSERHPVLLGTCIIFICWIPYIIIFYPGTLMWDGTLQLSQFLGYLPKTTHHPYAATTLMGLLYSVGKPLGDNAALFIYTTVQAAALCFTFAYASTTTRDIFRSKEKVRSSNRAYVWCLLIFALFPVFPAQASMVYKDIWYLISFILLFNLIARATIEKALTLKQFILFLVAGAGIVSFRNDGIVIFLATACILIFLVKKQRVRIITSAAAILAAILILNGFVFPSMGVEKYSNAEMMSVPLQQTARSLAKYPDEITPEEKATLQSLLKPKYNVDQLGESYQSWLSDPIKNKFKTFDSDSLKSYLSVWFAMFKRHPWTYVEATLAGTYQY
jgi:hypothetical protein